GEGWRSYASRSPTDADAADRHRDGSLRRLDDLDAERLLQGFAIARHAGAAHHDDIGLALVAELPPRRGHALQGQPLLSQLGDAEPDRQIADAAVAYPHRRDIAQMARHRAP